MTLLVHPVLKKTTLLPISVYLLRFLSKVHDLRGGHRWSSASL